MAWVMSTRQYPAGDYPLKLAMLQNSDETFDRSETTSNTSATTTNDD
eukprot:CAMPEP_0172464722 /NCGR_PEP_ID=MMETSP1065-20121228/51355_1 /TAXON_ID=265537 /ORGANISM="Amphiprora paludosa, Strain CCMP125" /LENGTH=46 /DNA_ID= /DNA_START= /DNA_END= /DNA_ORIENTATION=